MLEFDLEVILLLDHLVLHLGEIRPFPRHHQGEQLVAKAVLCHGEVDHGGLGLDFRRVEWVAQFGLHE